MATASLARKGGPFRKGWYTEPVQVSRHSLVGLLEGEDRMAWYYTEPFPVSRHSPAGMFEGQDRMAWRRGNYHTDCLLQEGCCDWLG